MRTEPSEGARALNPTDVVQCIAVACILLAMGGCFGKHAGPWRPAPQEDLAALRDRYQIESEGREVFRRDVSVWFIGPATGYPEWGVRKDDGSIEVVVPRKAGS